MKKLLIVSTIIAIMCVCLVGCIDNDKPVEITATAATVQSIGEVKASDYNDGYHSTHGSGSKASRMAPSSGSGNGSPGLISRY